MVRGIVLALREEEGLKALTRGQPAAMLRVCGRPAAEYAVDLLARAGVRRGMILTRERCDAAQARFDGAARGGVALRAVRTGEDAFGTQDHTVIGDPLLLGFLAPVHVIQDRAAGDGDGTGKIFACGRLRLRGAAA